MSTITSARVGGLKLRMCNASCGAVCAPPRGPRVEEGSGGSCGAGWDGKRVGWVLPPPARGRECPDPFSRENWAKKRCEVWVISVAGEGEVVCACEMVIAPVCEGPRFRSASTTSDGVDAKVANRCVASRAAQEVRLVECGRRGVARTETFVERVGDRVFGELR